ncbi:hypothetical protein HORIV_63390 [Vreelandella olivaria]|uniref:ABC transporter domain-containing protein n=1 Tax=Vreelandella olivaria TaxID=390919 RepID=A0ABM7GTB7_9GAMM|nr:hypothetical protein HORIV_63390 [Halomonas olivaria]
MDGITKSYEGDKPLFERLSMTVEAGERIAIIGPNGIGKTTLLKTLAGELHPDAGEVKYRGRRGGCFAQDHSDDFAVDATLFEWMSAWTQGASRWFAVPWGGCCFPATILANR